VVKIHHPSPWLSKIRHFSAAGSDKIAFFHRFQHVCSHWHASCFFISKGFVARLADKKTDIIPNH
jgi:hypothetical protein